MVPYGVKVCFPEAGDSFVLGKHRCKPLLQVLATFINGCAVTRRYSPSSSMAFPLCSARAFSSQLVRLLPATMITNLCSKCRWPEIAWLQNHDKAVARN